MKRLLLAIPLLLLLPFTASAQVPAVASFGIQTESSTSTPAQLFTACSQESIEIRDSSIGSARTAYNNSMNIALSARKDAEKAAIAISDEGEKKNAIKKAVDEYKKAVTQAQDALTKARKDAWDTFEANTLQCRDANKDGGKGVELQIQAKKTEGPSVKVENSATLRTVQDPKSNSSGSDEKTEAKSDNKSFGDLIKAQIDSIRNFFKR